MTATDPHSMGRNFAAHYAARDWNVVPVTSVIEVQYVMAPGTALVQKRLGGDAVTIDDVCVDVADDGELNGAGSSVCVKATNIGDVSAHFHGWLETEEIH